MYCGSNIRSCINSYKKGGAVSMHLYGPLCHKTFGVPIGSIQCILLVGWLSFQTKITDSRGSTLVQIFIYDNKRHVIKAVRRHVFDEGYPNDAWKQDAHIYTFRSLIFYINILGKQSSHYIHVGLHDLARTQIYGSLIFTHSFPL